MKFTTIIVLLLASAVSAQSGDSAIPGGDVSDDPENRDDPENPENPCEELLDAMEDACDAEKEKCMDECMDDEDPLGCDDMVTAVEACVDDCELGDTCGGATMTVLSCELDANPSCAEDQEPEEQEPEDPCEEFSNAMDHACEDDEGEAGEECMDDCMDKFGMGDEEDEAPPECDALKTAVGACVKECLPKNSCGDAMMETLSCNLNVHPSCVESARDEALAMA